MNPFNLRFRRLADEAPEAGTEVWYLHLNGSFGFETHEFRYIKVEKTWVGLDALGLGLGTSIWYDPKDPEPKIEPEDVENGLVSWKLIIVDDHGCELGPDTLWIPVTEVEDMIDKART